MKTPLPKPTHKTRPPLTLEEATESLINAVGGPKAAAALPGCPVGRSMLDKYMDADDPENRGKTIPARTAAYFESVAGEPHVTQWMAAQSGHCVVPLPDAAPMNLVAFVTGLGREAGDVFAAVGTALKDGRVTPGERVRLIREINDVIRVATAARTALEAKGK